MAFYHTDRDEAKHWPAWWQVAGAAWQIFSDLEPMTCNLRLAAKCSVRLKVVSVILRPRIPPGGMRGLRMTLTTFNLTEH